MRSCPLCRHAEINEINRRMIAQVDAATIAREYHVAHRAAMHHRRYHLPRLLQKVREVDQQLEVATLRNMLVEIGTEMRALYEQFKATKDFRGALVALDKLLSWWTTAAEMIGIAEPPEGHQEKPIDIAQAVRDIFGVTEMPTLDVQEQKALPPAPEDAAEKAPETAPETPTQAAAEPTESTAARYKKTSASLAAPAPDQGHWVVAHDPNLEEKVRLAKPVQDPRYVQLLDKAHADGRRLEVGEASPHMRGWDVAKPK